MRLALCLLGAVVGLVSGLSIVSRETRDGNGDGILDGIVLVFDGSIAAVAEKIADAASNGDFKVQGYTDSRGFVQQSNTRGYIETSAVLLGASFLGPDTGATPAVRYVASSQFPVPGLATEAGWTASVDKAAPVLTEAYIASLGSTIGLKFSEPVFSADFASFVIDNCRQASALTAALDAEDGEAVWKFTANNNFDNLDNGCTEVASSSSVPSFVDAAGNVGTGAVTVNEFVTGVNLAAAFVDQDQNGLVDGLRINPVGPGSVKEAWADYSLVQGSPTVESLLRITPNVFNLEGYTGLGQSAVVDNDWYYYFNFSESNARGTGTTGSMYFSALPADPLYNWAGPNADGLYGLTGGSVNLPNGMANAITVGDAAAPLILEAFTRDTDGDGQIDQIDVTFSETMSGADTGISNWLVTSPALVTSGSGYPNNNQVMIDVTYPLNTLPSCACFGTAVTPSIYYAGQLAVDPAGNKLVKLKAPLLCKDGASPVITTAYGWVGTPYVQLIFSEPVFPDPATGAVWTPAGFFSVSETPFDINKPMLIISSIVSNETLTTSVVVVALSRDLTDIDFTTTSISFIALESVWDASGNAAQVSAGATRLAKSNQPVPVPNHNAASITATVSVAYLIYAMSITYLCALFATL